MSAGFAGADDRSGVVFEQTDVTSATTARPATRLTRPAVLVIVIWRLV
jgi:hypothetical protein